MSNAKGSMRKSTIDKMNRLRALRGLPPMTRENMNPVDCDTMMERTRAAVRVLDTLHNDPELEMAGFMAIFHPGHPQTRELRNDARDEKEKRRKRISS